MDVVVGNETETARALPVVVDGTRYCLGLSRVANVVSVGRARDPTATPLSESTVDSSYVAGTLDVADRTVRVLDVRELFGADSLVERRPEGLALKTGAVVVFGTKTNTLLDGWLVDDVEGTGTFDPDEVEPVTGTARHVEGSVEIRGEDAILLDPVSINR